MADASAVIDARIAELPDWRGRTLAQVRALIQAAVVRNEGKRKKA